MLNSFTDSNRVGTEALNKQADTVEKCEEAAVIEIIVKEYEEIIRTKNKDTVCVCYHRGKVLRRFRRLKQKDKFVTMVQKFNFTQNTMIFKINIVNLIDKCPRLVKSSVTLGFLKIYFKDIKKVFEENSNKLGQPYNE